MSIFSNIKYKYEDLVYKYRDPIVTLLSKDHFALTDEELAWEAHRHTEEALSLAKGLYNSKVHRLPQPWRMIYTLVSLDIDVINGGFHQFFTNAGGIYDSHLHQDVTFLGHPLLVSLFDTVWAQYSEMDYTNQWNNRGKSWEYFATPYKDGLWEEETMRYYREVVERDSIMPILGRFIRNNFADYSCLTINKTEQGGGVNSAALRA